MEVTFEGVLGLAKRAVVETIRHASEQLQWRLPEAAVHGLCVVGYRRELLELEDTVGLLVNEGRFPVVVDLAIRGLIEGKTFVLWIPMGGPETSFLDESWHGGLGPFKPAGVMSPKSHFRLTPEELERLASEWVRGE